MFELLSIVCTAAALSQVGGCIPDQSTGAQAPRPDSYEMRVAPGTYQLSYAGHGKHFAADTLLEHWRRRASQLCAGTFSGQPLSQTTYPDPGYELMVSRLFLASSRSYNVEVYGVAYCADGSR
jgi:hypothetical protein